MRPFTREQFLGVFADYNAAIWPAQVVAYGLGLMVVAMVLRPSPLRHRAAAGVLAAMWVWTGVAYHGLYFARINPAELVLCALFVVQGVLFVVAGVARRRSVFGHSAGLVSVLGWMLIIPLAWSLLGGSAAFMLGVPQDWPLHFSGPTIVLLVLRGRQRRGAHAGA